ncbi:MAG: SPOR domain-containing protein [Caldimicrobium sp.]
MDKKKFKFELSFLGILFVILFTLCLLVWTFILGVWIGTKIGGKPQSEEVALESKKELVVAPSLFQKQTVETNATRNNETTYGTPLPPQEPQSALKEEKTSQPQEQKEMKQTQVSPMETPKPKKEEKTKVKKELSQKEQVKKEVPKYKKREVAQIASKVKSEATTGLITGSSFYTLQVGAFSQKEKADEIKSKAEKIGYIAQVKEVSQEGKHLYKVFVGKFTKREEAEQAIASVKSKLGVEKPFIVEVK